MAALSSAVTTALPVFTSVSGYLTQQDRLDQTAERDAANQSLAERKLQLQQEKLAAGSQGTTTRADTTANRLQASQELQMRQLQERQAADTVAEDARIQTQMDQAVLAANSDEQSRRDTLRQGVAKSTVSLAGQGIDPHDGSGQALLMGQIKSADQQRQSAEQATRLRLQALRQQADALNQQNLLEQSQLAARQRLQWANTFG
jgi:hypothetical protein